MTDAMRKVLDLAAKLSRPERAKVALEMLDSLDDADQARLKAEFDEELLRRLAEMADGTDPGVPAEVVHAEIRQMRS